MLRIKPDFRFGIGVLSVAVDPKYDEKQDDEKQDIHAKNRAKNRTSINTRKTEKQDD